MEARIRVFRRTHFVMYEYKLYFFLPKLTVEGNVDGPLINEGVT